MAEIVVRGLVPGSSYGVQAQAYNDSQHSAWSPMYTFAIAKDTTAPAVPATLTWASQGNDFVAKWDSNTESDFSHYVVTLTALTAGNTTTLAGTTPYTFTTRSNNYTLTYDTNANIFSGTARPRLRFSVVAVDTSNNSSVAAEAIAENAVPANVTGTTATATADGVIVKWDAVADLDLAHYELYYTTGAPPAGGATGTKVNVKIYDTSYEYITTEYTTDYYFYVKAVDIFGLTSAGHTWTTPGVKPRNYWAVDTIAPTAPTGLSTSSTANTITVQWTGTASDTIGHRIRWRATTSQPWSYMDVGRPDGTTAAPWPIITGLVPSTTYTVEVSAYDMFNNFSMYSSASTTQATTAPDALTTPTGLIGTADQTRISIAWNRVANATEYHAELRTADAGGGGQVAQFTTTGTVAIFSGLTANTTYYPRVRAQAPGVNGSYATPTPAGVTTPATPGQIQFSDIGGQLNGSVLIDDTVRASTLRSDTSLTENLGVAGSIVMGHVPTYDGNGVITNPIVPTVANVPEIRSGNYDATNGVGYRLTNETLDIQSGTINARALRIQSSQNIMPSVYASMQARVIPMFIGGVTTGTATAISTAQKKFGTQSMMLTPTTTNGSTTRFHFAPTEGTLNVPVQENQDYTISLWIYPTTSRQVNLGMRRTAGGSLGNYDAIARRVTDNNQTLIANTWQQIYVTALGDPGTLNGNVYISMVGPGAVYVEGVMVQVKNTLETKPSAWTPPGVTTIDGGIIRTGEIRSNDNNATGEGDSTSPVWSIDVAGTATFGDARVRGRMIVGQSGSNAAGSANATGSIRSWDYDAGQTGWAIAGNGNVDFNGGSFRGTFSAGGKFHVDTSGNVGVGSTSATTGNFRIAGSDGSVTIAKGSIKIGTTFEVANDGTITASNGTIAGWSINNTQISKNNLYMNSTGYVAAYAGATHVVMDGRTGASYPLYVSDGSSYRFTVDTSGNVWIGNGNITSIANGGTMILGPDGNEIRLRATIANAPSAGGIRFLYFNDSGSTTYASGGAVGYNRPSMELRPPAQSGNLRVPTLVLSSGNYTNGSSEDHSVTFMNQDRLVISTSEGIEYRPTDFVPTASTKNFRIQRAHDFTADSHYNMKLFGSTTDTYPMAHFASSLVKAKAFVFDNGPGNFYGNAGMMIIPAQQGVNSSWEVSIRDSVTSDPGAWGGFAAATYRNVSDAKLKTNIEEAGFSNVLEGIKKTSAKKWLPKNSFGPDRRKGFVANELPEEIIEWVDGGEQGQIATYQSDTMMAYLWEVSKALLERNEALEAKVTALEARLAPPK